MSFWIDEESLTDDVRLMTPHGALDNLAYEVLEKAILDAQRANVVRIVVDLADVPRVSSVGMGVLISCQTDLQDRGRGALVLVAPQQDVLRVFDVMDYVSVFTIVDTVDEALEFLKQV